MLKKKELGLRISQLRKKANLSQTELGKKLGYQQSDMSRIEKGTKDLTFSALIDIAQLFNVSTDFLLGLSDANTDNKDLQFICDYIGLSTDAIKKLRKYCIPNLSSFDDSIPLDEDSLLDKKFEIERAKEEKNIINNFIASYAFDSMIDCIGNAHRINEAFISYLAIYFGDYEYFYELNQIDEKTIDEIFYFADEFSNDEIHFALNNQMDLAAFKFQKSMSKYFDDLSSLNELVNPETQRAFDLLRYIVWSSVKQVYKNNDDISLIQENITEFKAEDFESEFLKLKNIYKKLKSNLRNQ